jgi:hypothetical protein
VAATTHFTSSHNRLELDGQDAGPLLTVEGGEPYAEVVSEAGTTVGAVVGKHLGAVHYADITIECSLTPGPPLANWIAATLSRNAPSYDGAIVELDSNLNEVSRLKFQNAVVREIEFPGLDTTEKRRADLIVRLAPESTLRQAGSGVRHAIGADTTPVGATSKQQQTSNFQLTIDGLTGSSVTKVDPLVVGQVFTESLTTDRIPLLVPTGLRIPDLVVTLREAADWYAWRDAFMVAGIADERSGTLEYLAQDMKTVLVRIEFRGLGIHSLVAERTGDAVGGPRRMRASMYCENLTYVLPVAGSAPSSAQPPAPPSRVDVIAPLASRRPFARMKLG